MNVDEDLRAVLGVEPSPAFVAGIRARVAREPAPAAKRAPIVMIGAACAALAFAVALPLWHTNQTGETAATETVQSTPAAPIVPVVRPVIRESAPHAMPPARRALHARAAPPVLVSGTAAEGLADLAAAVQDGRIDLTSLPVDDTFVAIEPARGETIIAPMPVHAVAAMTASEGVRW